MQGQDGDVLKTKVTEAGMNLRGDGLTGQCLQSTHLLSIHAPVGVDASAARRPDVTRKPWCVQVTEHETSGSVGSSPGL